MDANKDYYATLGLTPSADVVVVRAAYKALAQRYHPDKSGAPADQASARMAEINEAYGVLSDPANRAEYDKLRKTQTQDADTAFTDSDPEPTAASPLDADWQTALQFYPELGQRRARLAEISWKLADAFCARILNNKEFAEARTIADQLENEFLSLYFGSDPGIVNFAKILILDGRRDAARDLNRAITVIGHSTDSNKIIQVIRRKHGIADPKDAWHYDRSGRRGITAQRYAREYGIPMRDVMEMIQRGDIVGFKERGVIYIEIDENGEPARWHSQARIDDVFIQAGLVIGVIVVLISIIVVISSHVR